MSAWSGPSWQFLGNVAALLLLAQYHLSGVGLESRWWPRVRRGVLEKMTCMLTVGTGRAHQGGRGSVGGAAPFDVEGERTLALAVDVAAGQGGGSPGAGSGCRLEWSGRSRP